MTIKFCSLNAWGSRSNTENTHDAIASLEKLSHRCVFLMCDVCGAVDAAAHEQDEKENGSVHVRPRPVSAFRLRVGHIRELPPRAQTRAICRIDLNFSSDLKSGLRGSCKSPHSFSSLMTISKPMTTTLGACSFPHLTSKSSMRLPAKSDSRCVNGTSSIVS